MNANKLVLENRYRKPGHPPVVSIDDFTYQEGSTINAETIIDDPTISLYCLDDEHRRAIFVTLPSIINLSESAFYYQTQFDHAHNLIAISYDSLHDLATRVNIDLDQHILLYSTGRCGSTLLSHIFNESGEVASFSEPDMLTQLIYMQEPNGRRDQEIISLIRACTQLIFKPTPTRQVRRPAIKFRNQCVALMELFYKALPKAKNIFLYRNAFDYVASEYRLLMRHQSPNLVPINDALAWLQRYHGPITPAKMGISLDTVALSWIECFALNWLIIMDRALAYLTQNIPILPVRYEGLNSNRIETVTQLFEYCNLPSTNITQALKAFERDSQQGTALARDNSKRGNAISLNEMQRSQIAAIIAQHPVIQTPDFIMPGTLME